MSLPEHDLSCRIPHGRPSLAGVTWHLALPVASLLSLPLFFAALVRNNMAASVAWWTIGAGFGVVPLFWRPRFGAKVALCSLATVPYVLILGCFLVSLKQ